MERQCFQFCLSVCLSRGWVSACDHLPTCSSSALSPPNLFKLCPRNLFKLIGKRVVDLQLKGLLFTARKRRLRRLCVYTCLSVILFTGGGGSMCGRGHVWQGGWVGVHGRGGMHGGGHAWWGACMAGGGGAQGGGMRGRYYEIRSMSGRYASYWNAFLLSKFIVQFH